MLPDRKPCLEWSKARDAYGYGATYHNGKVVKAHRLAYCQAHGMDLADIAGQVVRHGCDNPSCVEPTHLSLGSQADNVQDMVERGRHVGSSGARIQRKLTDEQIAEALHSGGSKTAAAKRLGVSRAALYYWEKKHERTT